MWFTSHDNHHVLLCIWIDHLMFVYLFHFVWWFSFVIWIFCFNRWLLTSHQQFRKAKLFEQCFLLFLCSSFYRPQTFAIVNRLRRAASVTWLRWNLAENWETSNNQKFIESEWFWRHRERDYIFKLSHGIRLMLLLDGRHTISSTIRL